MKRSGPLRRGTPLKRGAPLRATRPMKRRSPDRTDQAVLAESRVAVFRRAAGRCEARWPGCTGVAQHAHHRRRRSQGGTHDPENLLAVCAHCHEQIHRNPEQAFTLGHLYRSGG